MDTHKILKKEMRMETECWRNCGIVSDNSALFGRMGLTERGEVIYRKCIATLRFLTVQFFTLWMRCLKGFYVDSSLRTKVGNICTELNSGRKQYSHEECNLLGYIVLQFEESQQSFWNIWSSPSSGKIKANRIPARKQADIHRSHSIFRSAYSTPK